MEAFDVETSPCIPKSSDCKEKLGVDEMLQRFSGEFGPWQLRQFVLCSLAWIPSAFHIMVVVFTDRQPEWRCTAAPEPCSSDLCNLDKGLRESVGGPSTSTVAEWGLMCGGSTYISHLAQSAFFAGSMLGAGVSGHLSDSFLGRRGTVIVLCTMSAAFGCSTALSPAYWVYVILRFLTGISIGGLGNCAFTLATEPVGPTKRAAVGMSSFYFFSIGCILLSCIAYLFPLWRTIYVISSLPSLLFVVTIIPFIVESPRWYLIRRRSSEAMSIMKKIAERNSSSKAFPVEGISLILDCDKVENHHSPSSEEAISGSIIDALRCPTTRSRVFMTVLINFFATLVYYGLSLNVVNLKTSVYVSVILNAVAEMPAHALSTVFLKWWGRKPMLIGSLWLGGTFCILGSLVSGDDVRMRCGVVGISAISATFNLFYVYTMEMFPTVVRTTALGCVTLAGEMGAIIAPFVVALGGGGGGLSFVVFGVCSLVGGFMAFLLPETMNRPLYDTFAGVEGELEGP